MRADLHLHSRHSKRPSIWLLKKLGCPESFTDPVRLYEMLREMGMDLVTFTDHNVIDACLDIAHLPGTFISEEVTTYFPEDRCKLHVCVWDITVEQHEEIQDLREDVYDLVAFLNENRIAHSLAHPFYKVSDHLTDWHIERTLLLFRCFELNGDQLRCVNHRIERLVRSLTPERIQALSAKHRLEPAIPEAWRKTLTAGSDDHSSMHPGRTWTEVPGATSIGEFFAGIEDGRAKVYYDGASPRSIAHNLYGVAYQFYKDKLELETLRHDDDLLGLLDSILRNRTETASQAPRRMRALWAPLRKSLGRRGSSKSAFSLLRKEASELIQNDPDLLRLLKAGARNTDIVEDYWFQFVSDLSNKVLFHFFDRIVDRLKKGHIFDLFHAVGSSAALYGILAPFFVSYSLLRKCELFSEEMETALGFGDGPDDPALAPKQPLRVAHFTDTFFAVNGVARTLQRQSRIAAEEPDMDLRVVTCGDPAEAEGWDGLQVFEPVGEHDLPEYPEFKIHYPPLLDMIDHCYRARYGALITSTPGTLGLSALLVARILRVPIAGVYTTQVPQYSQVLTESSAVHALTWKFIVWFYDQMDVIYVLSKASADELVEKGISREKIRQIPRGVDTDRFRPNARSADVRRRLGLAEDDMALLYVGRVSKEKNLEQLARTLRRVRAEHPRARLVCVGDGPYRREMESLLSKEDCIFTGYIEGEELTEIYASCDAFVFPSTTDTFGNVVLEAQASGLPVIVSDRGGPQENLLPGETGHIFASDDDDSLLDAMRRLVEDPARTRAMGRAARAYVEKRSYVEAFRDTWRRYETDLRQRRAPATVQAPVPLDFIPEDLLAAARDGLS